ncbi:MAG: ABC transporter ATP-binding protein, partial [Gemmatimonadaceae bacterium]
TSNEWKFFSSLRRADARLSFAWWLFLIARGVLPALLAVASGTLIGAVNTHGSLTRPLVFVTIVFVAFQVLSPLHRAVGANLGNRMSAWLNDRLMQACTQPQGMAHLERSELTKDLSVARDFDLGIMGPPLFISMEFISGGLVELLAGAAAGMLLFGFAWWAPLVLLTGWGSTHWLLREAGVWKDRNTDEVRSAQRHADYAYRLAVDPPAAKELRLFGLADWVVDRFAGRRQRLYELRWQATRLREKSVLGCLLVVVTTNAIVFWAIAVAATDGRISLGAVVVYLQAAIGTSAIAFGGMSWALDGAAAPVAAVLRLESAMAAVGQLTDGGQSAANLPSREIRFRGVTFGYESSSRPVLEGFDLTIPAGTSLAIVGVNGAGKTTLAKLLCRLYDPQSGAIEVDGVDLRKLDLEQWRGRVAAVFQDFVRYELPLRENVAPRRDVPDAEIDAALRDAGAESLASLDTVLARGYPGGTDLSGGQWQRVALARALAAVRGGAGLVLLDEPTAQLDVRGEAEIFERVLAATRHCTTILVSHRFSTVRQADRICVLEAGKVVELGTHDELIARGGRYATMFGLQASRFVEKDEHGEEVTYDTLT